MKKLGLRIKYLLNSPRFWEVFINIAYLLISFFFPFLLAILLFKGNGYYPFVNNGQTLMMIDMSGQYVAFFRYYKDILDGKTSLFHTLSKATGGDFLSLFNYYLASPFNLILKFFSASELPKALTWIVILKISASGLTAYITLNKLTKNKIVSLLLSILYALTAYNFVYYSNVMWLDGVILVPLIGLGIVYITENKSPLLYIISLALAIITCWYIGIMLCMFAVFFFLTKFFASYKKGPKNKKTLLVFTIASLLAGIISLGFWGSALSSILNTKSTSNFTNLARTIREFYTFFKIERGFIYQSYAGMSDINGQAINFYVGALPVVLTLLYFFNSRFTLKQKGAAFCLLLFYIFAFFNKGLDHLLHGGAAPNWFPGRYAFIFSFILIYYAAKSLVNIKHVHYAGYITTFVLYIALYFSFAKSEFKVPNGSVIFFSLAVFFLLILTYSDRFIALIKNPKYQKNVSTITTSLTLLGLSVVALLNVYGNNHHILASFNSTLHHPSLEVYQKDEAIGEAIDFVKSYDTSLYRMEKSFLRSGAYNNSDNDSLYYNYNGISHFSSTEKSEVNNHLKKLGFHYNGFHLNYVPGSTLSVSSFLGVKYLLDKVDNSYYSFSKGFIYPRSLTKIDDGLDDGITTYVNEYALPLLMATTKQHNYFINEGIRQSDDSMYWFNRFEYQNELFKNLTRDVVDIEGRPKDIFKKASYTTMLSNVTYNETEKLYNGGANGSINFNVSTNEPGNYYYFITASNMDNLLLYQDSTFIRYFNYFSHQINGLKKTANPTTTLTIRLNEANNHKITEEIYYEDLSVLEEYINAIKAKALLHSLTTKDKAKYEGKLTTSQQNQDLLLTIPYDKNFKVTVDGKKVAVEKRFNIYIGFVIEKAGEHNIVIKYSAPIFQVGVPVGIFLLGATLFAHFKFKKILFKKEDEPIN